jgi:hypothetical protein
MEEVFGYQEGKDSGFLVFKVARGRTNLARTFDAALWKNSDIFHEHKQHYEEFLELGDSLFPLTVDSEISS